MLFSGPAMVLIDLPLGARRQPLGSLIGMRRHFLWKSNLQIGSMLQWKQRGVLHAARQYSESIYIRAVHYENEGQIKRRKSDGMREEITDV